MPRKHRTNFPDIVQEESRANIKQKDKILRNMGNKKIVIAWNFFTRDIFDFIHCYNWSHSTHFHFAIQLL